MGKLDGVIDVNEVNDEGEEEEEGGDVSTIIGPAGEGDEEP